MHLALTFTNYSYIRSYHNILTFYLPASQELDIPMCTSIQPTTKKKPNNSRKTYNMKKKMDNPNKSYRRSDNSPLLIVFSANHIDQSIDTFMQLKVG